MNTTFAQIREKSQALNAQIAALRQEAADQIKPLLQQFIAEHPLVSGIRWNQYTPYFNDGDTCEFSVHEARFQFGGSEDGGDYDDGYFDLPYNFDSLDKNYYDNLRAACADIQTLQACKELQGNLQSLEDELEVLFGDHAQVTVTKDGVDVEGYSHD